MIDGNEAAAHVAYRINEVCAIYPITPSSTMAELADQWASEGRKNLWGQVPIVAEMQSEGGAAGAVHGALQTGALTTTFTASQGLLLMIPNMYKIAGELTPAVFHVAARSLASHALSIFGDHADVMAVRSTGFAQLASASVQEAHDMALIAQSSSLQSRVPFIHFFDGFRTSHEINGVRLLSDGQLQEMIRDEWVREHRQRGLTPDAPVIRGTAQNPDVYFQSREASNPYYQRTAGIVQANMDHFARMTGRQYRVIDYAGHPQARRVIVLMGSGAETVRETVDFLNAHGEAVGMLQVRLFRPFPAQQLLELLPATVTSIAVLDRCKEPGAVGEPLYVDIMSCLMKDQMQRAPRIQSLPCVIGGRYGLSSKEFTPAMVKAVYDELEKGTPRSPFTVGIDDDVTHTSLPVDSSFIIEPENTVRALFFGLGADGTVGANKNTIKIIGSMPGFHAQGYFVYDSKKSGSQTISHLRFGPDPINSSYLIQSANFIACHQFGFLERSDVLGLAARGATFLLNSRHSVDSVWNTLPRIVQQTLIERDMTMYVIDAYAVARANGMGARINTVMQTCFFAVSGILPRQQAIESIKAAIEKTYHRKGTDVVSRNFAAVDDTLANLRQVIIPDAASSTLELPPAVSPRAPAFVQRVTSALISGRGDALPVSFMPIDGTFPVGTATWEKRNVSDTVASWEPELCIQCGNCSVVCPHSVIRSRFYDASMLQSAPSTFKSSPIDARGFPDTRYTLQVYLEDCTGCNLCVEVCPASSKTESGRKAINLTAKGPQLEEQRNNIAFFETLPVNDRSRVDFSTVRGAQFLQPLFEFSGACSGCGETPYLKLLSQLFGDRAIIANATGCSSIYGGNLPTTPWTTNHEGRGPAWSNSLFEDNAEFGLGFRLTGDMHLKMARTLLRQLQDELGEVDAEVILKAPQRTESQLRAQRDRVAQLKAVLKSSHSRVAQELLSVADHLVRRSIWIVGGDGWAYDIGAGGLDHALASGRNINVLVMDTEVYSNTGGQMSKATPLGAIAKFAAAGKTMAKKDLAQQAIAYGNVYVARVAMGANPQQTLLAMREAEAYDGPSLILAYSHCIAHGIDMSKGMQQQSLAVQSGYWPLIRYNPELRKAGVNPFMLDSQRPKIRFKEYANNELRYRMLSRTHPQESERLMQLAQDEVLRKWDIYEELSLRGSGHYHPDARSDSQVDAFATPDKPA
ncbi:MAG: pyruvate:ferredoxin (flavodoxin) oxidoreductase [Granulosicoccus sp.]|nr:pyruvate:ferredoxin (flavodoxin) oxidoreductase [Granulosicoccus sp.]